MRGGDLGGARCRLGLPVWAAQLGNPKSPLLCQNISSGRGFPSSTIRSPETRGFYRAVRRCKLLRPQPAGAGSSARGRAGCGVPSPGCGIGPGHWALRPPREEGEVLTPPAPRAAHPGHVPPSVGNGSGEGQTRSAVRHGQVSPTPTEGGCLCPRRARGGGPTPTPCGPAGAQGTSPRTARGPPATPERGLCRSPTYSSMSMGQESGTAAAWRGESRRHVVSPAGYGQYSHGEGQRHGGTRGTGAGAAPVTGTVGEKEPRAPGTVDIACNDPGRGDRQSLGPAHCHPRHQGHSRWCAGRG